MYAQTINQTINGRTEWIIPGHYFRLLETVNPVDVSLFRAGNEVARISQVEAGFYCHADYDRVQITTGASEAIKFFATDQEGGYDRLFASVTIASVAIDQADTLVNEAAATVGTASGLVLAASASRKKIVFRAPSSNTASVALGANALTLADAGIVLQPGDIWEEKDAAPAAWYAIAGAASQALKILSGN